MYNYYLQANQYSLISVLDFEYPLISTLSIFAERDACGKPLKNVFAYAKIFMESSTAERNSKFKI